MRRAASRECPAHRLRERLQPVIRPQRGAVGQTQAPALLNLFRPAEDRGTERVWLDRHPPGGGGGMVGPSTPVVVGAKRHTFFGVEILEVSEENNLPRGQAPTKGWVAGY